MKGPLAWEPTSGFRVEQRLRPLQIPPPSGLAGQPCCSAGLIASQRVENSIEMLECFADDDTPRRLGRECKGREDRLNLWTLPEGAGDSGYSEDPSDKLPGATGVGPKRAAQLLRRHGTLEGVLEAGLFQNQAEMLRLYRLIATMDAKAPLPTLSDQEPIWASVSNLARTWGLNQLADRLDERVRPP